MLWLLDRKTATKDGAGHAGPAVHAVRLVAVSKTYVSGGDAAPALDGVSVNLARGSFTALLGWSSIMIPTGLAMRARPADAIGGQE